MPGLGELIILLAMGGIVAGIVLLIVFLARRKK
jgi:hypothetical protein